MCVVDQPGEQPGTNQHARDRTRAERQHNLQIRRTLTQVNPCTHWLHQRRRHDIGGDGYRSRDIKEQQEHRRYDRGPTEASKAHNGAGENAAHRQQRINRHLVSVPQVGRPWGLTHRDIEHFMFYLGKWT